MYEWQRRERKKKELERTKDRLMSNIEIVKRQRGYLTCLVEDRFMCGYWEGKLDVLNEYLRDVMEELEDYSDLEDN